MTQPKTLAEHLQDNSFRAERHSALLVTSPPLPEHPSPNPTGHPRYHQAWQSMRTLQAAAADADSADLRTHIAHRFAQAFSVSRFDVPSYVHSLRL